MLFSVIATFSPNILVAYNIFDKSTPVSVTMAQSCTEVKDCMVGLRSTALS